MYISVQENIRIEFDRFYEALKFHGHNIENDVSDLVNILEENIIQEYNGQSDEIYQDGWDEGYYIGRDEGHSEGYHDGYQEGYEEGFKEKQND
jgi:flagellar biosynthesis/type III secretory pathway protein FliH